MPKRCFAEMIKIKIIAVGNLKEKYLKDACEEYGKRLSAFASVEVVEIKESRIGETPSAGEIKSTLDAEGEKILAAIPERAYVAALCVEGKSFSSEEFAKILEDKAGEGTICFIIGASYGLSDKVKARSDAKISFSAMTFPHQLMRVILFEQIYRGFMINHGRTYHK